jgi:hypothetical protein
MAAGFGHLGPINKFLVAGADIVVEDDEVPTALRSRRHLHLTPSPQTYTSTCGTHAHTAAPPQPPVRRYRLCPARISNQTVSTAQGLTPLHVAVKSNVNGDDVITIIERLVKKGANSCAKNQMSVQSPLPPQGTFDHANCTCTQTPYTSPHAPLAPKHTIFVSSPPAPFWLGALLLPPPVTDWRPLEGL